MDARGLSGNDLAARAQRERLADRCPIVRPPITGRIAVGIGQSRRSRDRLSGPAKPIGEIKGQTPNSCTFRIRCLSLYLSFIFYFSLSAAFAIPSRAHAASLSPPGAPLTATAPIVDSPTLIGSPP